MDVGRLRELSERARELAVGLARADISLPGLDEPDRDGRFGPAFLDAALRAGLSLREAEAALRMAVGLGPLEAFIGPQVEELVVRRSRLRVLYRDGRVEDYPDLLDPEWVVLELRRVADATRRPVGGDRRFVTTDLRRPGAGVGRLRVSAVETPDGAALNIRLFPERPLRLGDLGLPDGFLAALKALRYERRGLLIAGDFAAGKSTLLNALLLEAVEDGLLPAVIEGFAELDLPADAVLRVEAPDPRLADEAMAEAVLRMRADVLAVGEVTAPEEARRFLWACQVGRPVWATIHGASYAQALATLTELCARAGMHHEAVKDGIRAGLGGVALLRYDFLAHRRFAAAVFAGDGRALWQA